MHLLPEPASDLSLGWNRRCGLSGRGAGPDERVVGVCRADRIPDREQRDRSEEEPRPGRSLPVHQRPLFLARCHVIRRRFGGLLPSHVLLLREGRLSYSSQRHTPA
jgi:hypothetical protein